MKTECPREQDVLDAVTLRDWETADIELRNHVATCDVCADLAHVAAVLREERNCGGDEARLPSSGLVWWRANLRARQEATRAAATPIAFAQGIAVACALGIAAAVLGIASPWVREWAIWIWSGGSQLLAASDTIVAALQGSALWFAVLATGLLFLSFVIYVSVADD